jgi:hypothetical protein
MKVQEPKANQFYRNGELVEYTGKSEPLHGKMAYEIVVVADSHRVGTRLVTYNAPEGN